MLNYHNILCGKVNNIIIGTTIFTVYNVQIKSKIPLFRYIDTYINSFSFSRPLYIMRIFVFVKILYKIAKTKQRILRFVKLKLNKNVSLNK